MGHAASLSHATPSAVSERCSELIGRPISRSFTTSCVCLELRPLPSRRYPASAVLQASPPPQERPASPSRASGWSSLTALWGFPCCARFPCVRAAASTPVQRLGVVFAHLTQPYQPSPKLQSGRPAHRPF